MNNIIPIIFLVILEAILCYFVYKKEQIKYNRRKQRKKHFEELNKYVEQLKRDD